MVPRALSADGSIVVGSARDADGADTAFRSDAGPIVDGSYHDGTIAMLRRLPGEASSTAVAVSRDGSAVVGTSGERVFHWVDGTMTDLGPGTVTRASADLSFPLGWDETWTAAEGWRSIRDTLVARGHAIDGWTDLGATGVSADGRVLVGGGVDPSGDRIGCISADGPVTCAPPGPR